MLTDEELANLLPGTKLSADQCESIAKSLSEVLSIVNNRRKGVLLVHNSLQNTIGLFQQLLGWETHYEVPFQLAGWDAERVIFDIVAQQENDVAIVEVKDLVTTRDLGQIYGYSLALKLAGVKAKLYLGTDILNYGNLLNGVVGEGVKELMHQKALGVILVDKHFLMVCDNHDQLTLKEMPRLLSSVDPVG